MISIIVVGSDLRSLCDGNIVRFLLLSCPVDSVIWMLGVISWLLSLCATSARYLYLCCESNRQLHAITPIAFSWTRYFHFFCAFREHLVRPVRNQNIYIMKAIGRPAPTGRAQCRAVISRKQHCGMPIECWGTFLRWLSNENRLFVDSKDVNYSISALWRRTSVGDGVQPKWPFKFFWVSSVPSLIVFGSLGKRTTQRWPRFGLASRSKYWIMSLNSMMRQIHECIRRKGIGIRVGNEIRLQEFEMSAGDCMTKRIFEFSSTIESFDCVLNDEDEQKKNSMNSIWRPLLDCVLSRNSRKRRKQAFIASNTHYYD